MHKIHCYLCGADEPRVLFSQQGHDPYLNLVCSTLNNIERNWVVCNQCGFVYRNPVLNSDELETLYKRYEQDVFASTDPDVYFDHIVSLPRDVSENWKKIDWLAGILKEQNKEGERPAVLDIGCGGGTLLHTLCEHIPLGDVCGVELNPAYAKLAARRLNADIRNELYVSGAFERCFDLIVCTKVLEHVPDPRLFLTEMARDLSEDGFLFLEVPDVSDMYKLPPDNERFFIPHIYFFSVNTLDNLLLQTGFSVVETRVLTTPRNRSYLQIIAGKEEGVIPSMPPFDDPEKVAHCVAVNIEHYASREGVHG